MNRVTGTAGDDLLTATVGGIVGFDGNDTLVAIAQDNVRQIHTYGGDGDDLTVFDYANITGFSHGHHSRGGDGNDVFDFVNIDRVNSTIVGRIEDFDYSRDKIMIEGQEIDLFNLPSNVRIVEYAGELQDPNATPQQWLLIDTGGGHIFYALEGARIDMATADAQEPHFLTSAPNFSQLVDVDFIDQKNHVPDGYTPDGGIIINDTDVVRDDVLAHIEGGSAGDLIAAGLNDDTVYAHDGNDMVWGGSGHDEIHGGNGLDTIEGGTGNDTLYGGGSGDLIDGGHGDDVIHTDWGWDTATGGAGNDTINGAGGNDTLSGDAGNDVLDGGNHNDVLNGGSGRDTLTGGDGVDEFVFDDFDWGFDLVNDFDAQAEKIRFAGEVNSYDDLIFINYMYNGVASTLIRFRDDQGARDNSMGGVVLNGVDRADLSTDDFLF